MRRSQIAAAGMSLIFVASLPSCRQANGPQRTSSSAAPRPNIIFLTVDTLRADHLALHGYVRNTMPAIEAFAKTAVVFDNAVVPRGKTRPSYASMLTGLYPFHHGVRNNEIVLSGNLVTLPEVLKRAGYHTAGFVSNYVLVAELSGIDQGFDVYDDRLEEVEKAQRVNYERTAENTLAAIVKWLDSDPLQPFFLFTHFIDPHGPYTPPDRFDKMYRSTSVRILKRGQMPPYQYIQGRLNYYDYVDRYDGEVPSEMGLPAKRPFGVAPSTFPK